MHHVLCPVFVWRHLVLFSELPEKIRLVIEAGTVENFRYGEPGRAKQLCSMLQANVPDEF